MPLALVLVTFALIFAALAATTAATQIVGNRSEAAARAGSWALESVLNRAAERVRTAAFPANLPTDPPTVWTEVAGQGYVSRWWTAAGGTDQTLVVIAQVQLASPSASAGVLQAGQAYLWNPQQGEWNIAAHIPELE
jgi:NADPH-dependent 2,4-dienoyl-CoA reductase/sulfur reductase-like enzyme